MLVINPLIIAEIVWTLESFYPLTRASIRDKRQATLNAPGLELANQPLVLQALSWYAELNVDFIDAYHAAWARQESLAAVYTFDRKHFARIPGIDCVVPGRPTE